MGFNILQVGHQNITREDFTASVTVWFPAVSVCFSLGCSTTHPVSHTQGHTVNTSNLIFVLWAIITVWNTSGSPDLPVGMFTPFCQTHWWWYHDVETEDTCWRTPVITADWQRGAAQLAAGCQLRSSPSSHSPAPSAQSCPGAAAHPAEEGSRGKHWHFSCLLTDTSGWELQERCVTSLQASCEVGDTLYSYMSFLTTFTCIITFINVTLKL